MAEQAAGTTSNIGPAIFIGLSIFVFLAGEPPDRTPNPAETMDMDAAQQVSTGPDGPTPITLIGSIGPPLLGRNRAVDIVSLDDDRPETQIAIADAAPRPRLAAIAPSPIPVSASEEIGRVVLSLSSLPARVAEALLPPPAPPVEATRPSIDPTSPRPFIDSAPQPWPDQASLSPAPPPNPPGDGATLRPHDPSRLGTGSPDDPPSATDLIISPTRPPADATAAPVPAVAPPAGTSGAAQTRVIAPDTALPDLVDASALTAPPGPDDVFVRPAPPLVVVTGDSVFLREAPTVSAADIGQFDRGTEGTERERRGNWVRLTVDGETGPVTGWMFFRYVATAENASEE